MIAGESGTGKELVARMVHDRSTRAGRAFVAVNCGALTETLMEAELFGHERGAFTGAQKKREGRFKAADGGTIFLDEVAELPLTAQAKLLRVLQEGTFEPLGSNTAIKVDVRVVSATHRNLKERVAEKLFREDLLYRINVIEIDLPAVARATHRSRLAGAAISSSGSPPRDAPVPKISPAVWTALSAYPFPGNVRELSHAIQHAVVMASGSEITVDHLPAGITGVASLPTDEAGPPLQPIQIRPFFAMLRELEKGYLVEVLRRTDGNLKEAATLLQIPFNMLRDKLKGHGIPVTERSR